MDMGNENSTATRIAWDFALAKNPHMETKNGEELGALDSRHVTGWIEVAK